ncbi:radical SAM protein [Nitrospira sp. M1]
MIANLYNTTKPALNLLRRRPLLGIFEVTLRCNSSCGYCDLPLNQGRYEMSRQEIRQVFSNLYHDGLRFLLIQGGEPLLRTDLPEILDDLTEIGFSLSLITNGTKLTPARINRLAHIPLNISVSLDTLDRDLYKQIRGADQLGLVLNGIDALADYPHPKYLTCIVSEVNRHHVMDVVRFARDRGFIPVVGAYHWDIDRYGKVDLTLQYQKATAVSVFQSVLDSGLVPRGYFRQYLRDNITWLNGGPLNRCDAGRYSIAIDASGNVAPCLALTHQGNLLRSSLDEILHHFDQQTIEECSNQSSCNMLCSRVIGSTLRQPLNALLTPTKVEPFLRNGTHVTAH